MTYYSKPVTSPRNMQDGLCNFVQMIINAIERGDHNEALLKAVDLKQDIESGIYKATTEGRAQVPADEHFDAVAKAKDEGYRKGYEVGSKSVRTEMRRLLGEAA